MRNKTEEVKTVLKPRDFDEFIKNLGEDGISRSEWIRDMIIAYNTKKANARKVVSIDRKFTSTF